MVTTASIPANDRTAARRGPSGAVSIGVAKEDLALRERSTIYFHLGDEADLSPRAGVCVPLGGQGVFGLLNALRWALAAIEETALVQIGDLVDHAQRSAASYRSLDRPAEVEAMAREMARELRRTFPRIEAVLGTGFPFYCVEAANDPSSVRYPVPESIRYFTAIQDAFFASKLVPAELDEEAPVSVDKLRALGCDPGQSEFNAYEYARWGLSAPAPPERGLLREYLEANTLEPADRVWPCDVCTKVHNPAEFPRQAWVRDFMRSCASCRQTAFLPRAVGVLGSDVDLIVVADGSQPERLELAARIAEWVDDHPVAYRHDTDWSRQLTAPIGPLDVFTIARDDFWEAAGRISSGDGWMEVTVPCDVGWLPLTHIDYEIGKYFPLCVELIETSDASFDRRFARAQAAFARNVRPASVLAVYSSDSPYLRQLASNATVQDLLERRSRRWAGAAS